MEKKQFIKKYILIRDKIDVGHAMAAIDHGAIACHLKFQTDVDYQDWLKNSFRVCVCSVNDQEFESAKKMPMHVLMTEGSLGGIETALVFCPRQPEKLEKAFKFYKLWK